MRVLRLECAPEDKDRLIAELWERGTSGIIEDDDGGLAAYFDSPFDASALGALAARWDAVEDRDWVGVAESQWSPALVGARFFLVPSWRDDPTPPGRLRLEMQPGLVCGTGWHSATQLAIEAMESCAVEGSAVLDVGTGSGILAVAAALLGARRVYACDIDFEAARAAADRLKREGVAAGVFGGSARSVRPGSVDLVVMNINAETAVALAEDIRRVLVPGGAAILSGFPERSLARVEAAFGGGSVLRKDGWATLVC